jgi:hypothetical protein
MLGYNPTERKPGNKRLQLLVQNLENIVELLKEELVSTEDENFVEVSKLLQTLQEEDQTDYYEEED